MATLVRWEPFRDVTALQNDMGRLVSAFFGQSGDETTGRIWLPAVDVWETDSELVYAFDLPGIPEENVSVELEDGSLTVSGARERSDEVKENGFYRYERRFGSFTRTVGIPKGVTEDGVSAAYQDGVLKVTVAKPEEPRPRRIEIATREKATIEGTAATAE
jgi:HSP20 family protein